MIEDQFPFRVLPGDPAERRDLVRDRLDAVLTKFQPLVQRIVRKVGHTLSRWDQEDAVQQVLIHLFVHSLPRFEPSRGKLKQFIAECAADHTRLVVRRIARGRRHPPASEAEINSLAATDRFDAGPLAEELLASNFFSRSEREAIEAIRSVPGRNQTAAAASLGLKTPAMTNRVTRARRRIAALEINNN